MTNLELAKALKNGMFADRETVREAFDYAFKVADASNCPPAVMTAIMVLSNTIAKQIEQNEQEIA